MALFGYTILYVSDVEKAVHFYTNVFDFELKFITPEKDYAELKSGSTTLAFASHTLAQSNFTIQYHKTTPRTNAPSFELGMVTDNVDLILTKALNFGAELVSKPVQKPWGQTVCYIRDTEGFLVEICTAIG